MMSDFGVGRQYCQNRTSIVVYTRTKSDTMQVKKQAKKSDIIYGWPLSEITFTIPFRIINIPIFNVQTVDKPHQMKYLDKACKYFFMLLQKLPTRGIIDIPDMIFFTMIYCRSFSFHEKKKINNQFFFAPSNQDQAHKLWRTYQYFLGYCFASQ